MRRIFVVTLASILCVALGPTAAATQEGDDGPMAFPVEGYICSFLDGAGPADLDAWADGWNAWADEAGLTEYWAFTLTPFYFGPDQEFDFIWLGGSPNATSLGRDQDKWLTTGGESQASLAEIIECGSHTNFAALEFKSPGDGPPPDSFVVTLSDCEMSEGTSFDDVAPALGEWAAYREENGVGGGIWVFFPAYGGGSEKFDFKYVTSAGSMEALGGGWDQYADGGHEKATELFADKLDCDSSRVYTATMRRRAAMPDED